MHRNYRIKKQQGFISYIIVGLILLGLIVYAITSMSRNSGGSTATQSAQTNAMVTIKQSADFKTGFDSFLVSSNQAGSAMTFDAVAGTGLFDPAQQYTVKHLPPPGASVGVAAYTYNKLVNLPGIGAAATADYVSVLGNVTLPFCQQVNKILYGDAVTAAPATSAGALAAWTGGTAINDSANVSANYQNRPEGCVKTSDGSYVYYKALSEN